MSCCSKYITTGCFQKNEAAAEEDVDKKVKYKRA